ncbi:MAG TPA: lantibiotic dehydratase [Blastocatellia bacterium]|nr:lantibiotic dehydratase [Blastocatellia bacterium]
MKHLVPLGKYEWGVWRWVGLRGAGFPADQVFKLSAPECARAADLLLDCEEELRGAKAEALKTLNEGLDALRAADEWENLERRAPLLKAARQLKGGKIPDAARLSGNSRHAVEKARDVEIKLDTALAEYVRAHEAATLDLSQKIIEVARCDRFREALLWQNRRAVHNGIDSLLRKASKVNPRGFRQRQNEELIANYLQRYCVKNDTIGFFGPVGWAGIDDCTDSITFEPRADLLARRNVYFEEWCIDAIARVLARNQEIEPWMPPRLMPYAYFDGESLCLAPRGPVKISAKEMAILKSCDGKRTAKQIARDLLRDMPGEIKREQEVYRLMKSLRTRGVLSWALEIPIEMYPEKILREMLNQIEECGLRQQAMAPLMELEAARDEVIGAAGDADRLDLALGRLESTFTRLTGLSSNRHEGEIYAGRTLVYEDCQRGLDLKIGPGVIDALSSPLSILLTSARWFTFEAANTLRKALEQIYNDFVSRSGSKTIEYLDFFHAARSFFGLGSASLAAAILPEFQKRWSEILSTPEGQRRVHYKSEELRPHILTKFDAPKAGWMFARYHSPDLMLTASDVTAIERGEYDFVLGELHMGNNTLSASLFLEQHPNPCELFEALETDQPEPRLVLGVSKQLAPGANARVNMALLSKNDFRLIFAPDSYGTTASKELPIGSLVVTARDGGLIVQTRDGQVQFDIIEFFGEYLSDMVADCFRLFPRAEHTPRVTIDRLVVCRESWRFTTDDLPFACEGNEADCFVGFRRWASTHGIPRFFFVRTPNERKPIYVDSDSPVYINMLVKAIRHSAQKTQEGQGGNVVTLTEMLPAFDQLWLTDADGQKYTSEFRFVILDLAS